MRFLFHYFERNEKCYFLRWKYEKNIKNKEWILCHFQGCILSQILFLFLKCLILKNKQSSVHNCLPLKNPITAEPFRFYFTENIPLIPSMVLSYFSGNWAHTSSLGMFFIFRTTLTTKISWPNDVKNDLSLRN